MARERPSLRACCPPGGKGSQPHCSQDAGLSWSSRSHGMDVAASPAPPQTEGEVSESGEACAEQTPQKVPPGVLGVRHVHSACKFSGRDNGHKASASPDRPRRPVPSAHWGLTHSRCTVHAHRMGVFQPVPSAHLLCSVFASNTTARPPLALGALGGGPATPSPAPDPHMFPHPCCKARPSLPAGTSSALPSSWGFVAD